MLALLLLNTVLMNLALYNRFSGARAVTEPVKPLPANECEGEHLGEYRVVRYHRTTPSAWSDGGRFEMTRLLGSTVLGCW